ncbi:hypothetical protein CZ771_09305 [Actinomycetales bacterium JB111]|nr:hypothetical protein CZ771_09305 [Actinomycetales bacterium JB111]
MRDEAHGRGAWGNADKVVNHFRECGCTVWGGGRHRDVPRPPTRTR